MTTQCESDEDARRVLHARFQGVRQAREASEMERFGDVDVLICGAMAREHEGSWRESWTRRASGALRRGAVGGSEDAVGGVAGRGTLLARGVPGEAPLRHEFWAD